MACYGSVIQKKRLRNIDLISTATMDGKFLMIPDFMESAWLQLMKTGLP